MTKLLFRFAFWIWRTDADFAQYPYGPPDRWFWPRIAWEAYHLALRIEVRAALRKELK